MIRPRETMRPADPGTSYPRGEDWRDSSACTVDDWLWIDHKPSEEAEALAEARPICEACPVHARCLEYALADPTLDGIWAATTLTMRRAMRRKKETA